MSRTALLKSLRIAWTAICGLAAVLLVVLWVRSYWRADVVVGPIASGQVFSISSFCGELLFRNYATPMGTTWDWGTNSVDVDEQSARERMREVCVFGFALIDWRPIGWALIVPHPFLVSLFATASALVWLPLPKRFRLSTLLIAITLISIVLGAAVYFTKAPTTPPIDVGDFGRGAD